MVFNFVHLRRAHQQLNYIPRWVTHLKCSNTTNTICRTTNLCSWSVGFINSAWIFLFALIIIPKTTQMSIYFTFLMPRQEKPSRLTSKPPIRTSPQCRTQAYSLSSTYVNAKRRGSGCDVSQRRCEYLKHGRTLCCRAVYTHERE